MYRKHMKRMLDFLLALYIVLPVALVVLACALLVWLEDRAPVFLVEKRVGRYGKVFSTYKLRTTKMNAADFLCSDSSDYDLNHDPGLTKMGKFMIKSGIADITQVFNILTGDMSFIGPRPELWECMRSFTLDELRRFQVRPGITGYNQALCRSLTDGEQELQNDIYYAANASIFLDLKILSKTIQADLFPKRI